MFHETGTSNRSNVGAASYLTAVGKQSPASALGRPSKVVAASTGARAGLCCIRKDHRQRALTRRYVPFVNESGCSENRSVRPFWEFSAFRAGSGRARPT